MRFKLMYLKECNSGDLIRFRVGDAVSWGMVGKSSRGANFPLVVLTGQENAPFVVNAMPNGTVLDDFDTYPVMNFERNYEIVPDHGDECELGAGPLLKSKGSLVVSEDDPYLVVGQYRQAGNRWFHLGTGDVHGEPGGKLASFRSWSLNIPDLGPKMPSFQVKLK